VIQRAGRVGASTIVDTVTAVFSAPEFNPTPSFWWWLDYIDIPFDRVIARRVLIVVVVALAVIAIARYGHRWYLERRYGEIVGSGRSRGVDRDPWVAAQELAASGDFTAAAHALYLALLDGLARREQLRLHPAKTVGDYLRELRGRSSTLLPTVRDFARLYELVAYGFRECDAARYARLHALAADVIRPNG
jgi:hypothetical protein